jgi:AcrR family transcriptional regulator
MRAPERREQLLDIALELIVEKGFNALTMDAVAKAADVSRPVVYKQFADVTDLQHAVLDREEQRALEDLARSIPWEPGDADPDHVALDAIRRFLETVKASPDRWRVILLPVEGLPDAFRDRLNANRAATLRQLEMLAEWGVYRRGGPDDIDTELFARMLLEFVQASARLVLTEPGEYEVERIVRFGQKMLAGLPRGEPNLDAPPPAVDRPDTWSRPDGG